VSRSSDRDEIGLKRIDRVCVVARSLAETEQCPSSACLSARDGFMEVCRERTAESRVVPLVMLMR